MQKLFGTNAVIDETTATAKSRGFFKVTLIFLLIYFIGSMISGVVLTVPMYVKVFTDPEILELMSSGYADYDEVYLTVYNSMMNMPEWFNALSLFGTVGVIIAAIVYCTKFEYRRVFTLGFMKKGSVSEYLAGLAIGLVMFSAAYGIILVSGQATFEGFSESISIPMLLLFFVGFLIQGMSEEVLLRGYYFTTLSTKNIPLAIFASSAFFALLHLANNGISLMAILNLFLFGVFAALYYLRRGNLWGIGAIHSVWNFAQGNIFGCSVSGGAFGPSVFSTSYVDGNTLFNGGAFGPEGGLGVTIVLFIGIVVLLFMKNKKVEAPAFIYKGEFKSV